jgi:hypothetical protein
MKFDLQLLTDLSNWILREESAPIQLYDFTGEKTLTLKSPDLYVYSFGEIKNKTKFCFLLKRNGLYSV